MFVADSFERGIRLDRRDRLFRFEDRLLLLLDGVLRGLQFFGDLLVTSCFALFGLKHRNFLLGKFQFIFLFCQTRYCRLVSNDSLYDSVQSPKFGYLGFRERFLISEVFVAINNHSKLCSPIAEMVVRNHGMAEELEYLGNGIANDRGANVSNMHRLCNVG